MKEAGGDFCSVISGTKVVNNWLKIKVTKTPATSYQDKIVSPAEQNAI